MTMTQRGILRRTMTVLLALTVFSGVPSQGLVHGASAAREATIGDARVANSLRGLSNGKIAFVAYNAAAHLDVFSPDGPGFRQLVLCYRRGTGCGLTSLAWSPDGRRLAFLKAISVTNESLNVINADGSGAKRLAGCGPDCFYANPSRLSWSLDGSRIAFVAGNRIYEVRADGSRRSLLFSASRVDTLYFLSFSESGPDGPFWSPDGSHILFYDRPIVRPSATRSSGRIDEVWVMNADGTHQHRLFHSPRCPPGQLAATWSPDGRRIAFAFGGMYLMDADGRHVQRLIAPFDTDPAWRAIP